MGVEVISERNSNQLTAMATSARSLGLSQAMPLQRIQNMSLGTVSEIPSKIPVPSSATTHNIQRNQLNDDIEAFSPASAPLHMKLVGDVAVALAVTFGVSPFLTVVDKAIVESANGTKPILTSARDSVISMGRHPIQYIKSPTFLLMWVVYGATYSTANSFKTLEEHQSHQAKRTANGSSVNAVPQIGKMGTFLGTTLVNSGASIMKDRAYARMFSAATPAATSTSYSKSFPKATYAMWMMRDLSVIGSSFILPDLVTSHIVETYRVDAAKAQSICQLTIPVAAQFVAGPFHFLGLDLYNRQHHPSMQMSIGQRIMDRGWAFYQGIGPVVAARIARIAPGYGIGGVWNTKLRTAWRQNLVQRQNNKAYLQTPECQSIPLALSLVKQERPVA
ncbi:hypothetical protein IV203_015643 [Nitzschia inconspicua]|uniref:Uncharacterized protein n=1 Tax=Nitzschia inconspicua TaxID=303405 RepID=A0A9K3PVU9_9STRA|nr:hypothetical protein IV203_015643 [Nitzschia inconspicua]